MAGETRKEATRRWRSAACIAAEGKAGLLSAVLLVVRAMVSDGSGCADVVGGRTVLCPSARALVMRLSSWA